MPTRQLSNKLMLAGILALSFILLAMQGIAPSIACCSLGPARFSKTKGWVGEAQKDGKLVHILAYGNSVQNLPGKKQTSSGNAMFLPIPAVPGSMTDKNLLDMSKGKHVLADMENACRFQTRGASRPGALPLSYGLAPRIQVFEHGVYTVVLAQHASDIPAALARVPVSKRPALNQKIFSAYEKWYPNWTFALCCFDNKDEQIAEPMLWWYQPQYPNVLFFPALDAHTGDVPKLNEEVDTDHFLAASSPKLDELLARTGPDFGKVHYSDHDLPSNVKALLPKNVIGQQFKDKVSNGDFVMSCKDVRAGNFYPRRVVPPGTDIAAKLPNLKDLAGNPKF